VVTPLAQVADELVPNSEARHVFKGAMLKKEGGDVTGQAALAGEVACPKKNWTVVFPAVAEVGGVKVPAWKEKRGGKGGGGS